MPGWLRQSTAATVKVGPFHDDTDFKTLETALVIQKADVRLSKQGGTMAAASADQGASDAGAPHDALGVYTVSLNATDTDTLGRLRLDVKETGALSVWDEWQVVTQSAWDAYFAAGTGEPGQAAPPATLTHWDRMRYIYKWARNKRDNDGTTTKFYADDGTTVDQKATTSLSAGVSTKDEIVSGP